MKRELIATTTFGLEAVARREIENLGYEIIKTEDGKLTYAGDSKAIAKSNLWLPLVQLIIFNFLKLIECFPCSDCHT